MKLLAFILDMLDQLFAVAKVLAALCVIALGLLVVVLVVHFFVPEWALNCMLVVLAGLTVVCVVGLVCWFLVGLVCFVRHVFGPPLHLLAQRLRTGEKYYTLAAWFTMKDQFISFFKRPPEADVR